MLAKLGFVVVVLVFGGLMFVAGTLAPDSVRSPVAAFGHKAVAKLPLVGDAPKAESAAASAAPAQEPPPIASESLQLPIPLPAKAQYALQAGQFAVPESAAALGKRFQVAGIPFQILPVVDRSGQKWSVVAAGQYATLDEARTARMQLAKELGITEALPVIVLPAQGA